MSRRISSEIKAESGFRTGVWERVRGPWDLIIIGGGITGAGILREGTRRGLRALLVEQEDFAWGTSSRSSKLVHGGLRYLKEGRLRLTRASILEREHLLAEGPGLVQPLGFLWATFKGNRPGRWMLEAGLSLYDLLAGQWDHNYHPAPAFRMLAPHLDNRRLEGGFTYEDAKTDDARLVLRLIQEAVGAGGAALNYARAETLLKAEGTVGGIRLRDRLTGETAEVRGRIVVNATGAWADRLRKEVGAPERIRPLRGSHLLFPAWRLPVAQAISFPHPSDGRPLFIFPWQGITLVGTTDVDHQDALDVEPRISHEEAAYLLAAVNAYFPSLGIGAGDILSTFAGVRPVVDTGAKDPSHESRDHVVWEESGLLTVTGGKLTTFRLSALDALRQARGQLPELGEIEEEGAALAPVGDALPGAEMLPKAAQQRLWGRYGAETPALIAHARPDELTTIGQTPYLWAELRWSARKEAVVHLDDLLLRRLRLGLLLPKGGATFQERIGTICRESLGWSEEWWQTEWERYQEIWHRCYGPPDPAAVRPWKVMDPGGDRKRSSRTLRKLAYLSTSVALLSALAHIYRKQK